MTHTLNKIREFGIGIVCAIALAATPIPARPATNTAAILTTTAQAIPSCLQYQVKGVCFFLQCVLYYCQIRTSIRVSHYAPDAIISTYNDSGQHPWGDIGNPVAKKLLGIGEAMMGSRLDSTANTDVTNNKGFKSADAYANPLGMLAEMLSSGGSVSSSSTMAIPGFEELMGFPTFELPNIIREWTSIPTGQSTYTENARTNASKPNAISTEINSLPNKKMPGGQGSVADAISGGISGLPTFQGVLDTGLASMGFKAGNGLFCPSAASALSLHYQSDLDAVFWRGKYPLELLYPGSIIPGYNEITTTSFPLLHTWGNLFPRTGELVQQHPVKTSAIIASRVADIIRKPYQPHIYKRLWWQGDRGFKYFSRMANPKFQMVYPKQESSCVRFGTNDSLSLTSFGDFKTSVDDSYVWNLWQEYDCCMQRGIYLFSIP